jgi:translation elongation factor EF-G
MKPELPHWDIVSKRFDYAGHTLLFNSMQKVNRFRARYQVAMAFKAMQLEGYSSDTTDGYESLTRVMFFWSAIEQMEHALTDCSPRHLAAKYPEVTISGTERVDMNCEKFFKFIHARLEKTLKSMMKDFLDDKDASAFTLAKSIRHIYVHGHLTPNVAGVSPLDIQMLCNKLCDVMRNVIEKEFSARALMLKDIPRPW